MYKGKLMHSVQGQYYLRSSKTWS